MENPIFDAISKVDEKSVEQPTTPTASTTEVQTTDRKSVV
jgi:hypothetical protein